MPATMGVAPLVPAQIEVSPAGGDTDEVFARRRDRDRDPLGRGVEAALPFWSTPATVSTPGIVAGAPTSVVPLPRFPAAATMTTSCCEGVQERVVPAFRPLQRVAGQRHVDDVRPVVHRPAHRLRDLLVGADRAGAESDGHDSRRAAGADPDDPRPRRPWPSPGDERGDHRAVLVVRPIGRPSVRAPMPDTSVPPMTAPTSPGSLPSIPVSMTATVTPAPRVVAHAWVNP